MMSSNLKKFLLSTALFFMLILPTIVVANTTGGNRGGVTGGNRDVGFQIRIPNPLKGGTDNIPDLINAIITEAILPIGGVIVVIMIIYAGFMYVTAAGNETKVKAAHTALLYAVIGAAILLGARVLAGAIEATITQIGG